jgi:ketosteroid isomerase-like protein
MKNYISYALILALVFCGITSCTQKVVELEAEKAKVKLVVDQFEEFWETENMELLSKIMAHDSDMVNYGSDASEVFVGWEAFKDAVEKMLPVFENTKIAVKNQRIKLHSSGNVAWFSEIWDWDLMFDDQPVLIENQRLTGVLEKRNSNWVFVQFHNSVPVTE